MAIFSFLIIFTGDAYLMNISGLFIKPFERLLISIPAIQLLLESHEVFVHCRKSFTKCCSGFGHSDKNCCGGAVQIWFFVWLIVKIIFLFDRPRLSPEKKLTNSYEVERIRFGV